MFFFWILFIAIGGFCAWMLADDWRFLMRRQRRASGVVIDHLREAGDDGATFFKAKIRFRGEDGREHVIVDRLGLPKPQHAIGDRVEVAYPQGYPQKARPYRWWLKPVAFTLVAGALALMIAKRFGWLS